MELTPLINAGRAELLPGAGCEICGKRLRPGMGWYIEMNHSHGRLPQQGDRPEDLSSYPIGPDCLRGLKAGETT